MPALVLSLEPEQFVANAGQGLAIAGLFHGVKARLLPYRQIAQNLARLAIELDDPAGRSGRLIEWL